MAVDNKIYCNQCSNPAVYLDRERKIHLCKDHVIQLVEDQVREYLSTIHDLPRTIGIAFSGGKDSTALLKVFTNIQTSIPCRFIALTVDEGIEGYRQDTIDAAKETCRKLEIEHHVIHFSDQFGFSLDQLVKNSDRNACTICGILRRRALEILAREQNISVIATGHNLDDHAQTALMNAISGDVKKVFAGYGPSTWYARRIKPFAHISERKVTLYAILTGFFSNLPECPYAVSSLRGEIRTLLYKYESDHPGAMRNAAHCEEEIRRRLSDKFEREPYQICSICGWPASGKVCQVCTLLKGT